MSDATDGHGNPAGSREGATGAGGCDRLTAPADAARRPRLPFLSVGGGGGLEAAQGSDPDGCPATSRGVAASDGPPDPLADLRRANAELAAARSAALTLMEDAIRARDALRASEERQAFLLRLSDALRSLADPVRVQEVTTRLLGEHLQASRVVYAEFVVEGGRQVVVVECEYRGPGAASFVGRHPAERFGPDVPDLRAGRIVAVPDTEAEESSEALQGVWRELGVRARLGVPLVKGDRLTAGFWLHLATPHVWTAAEVQLVTEVAERTWAAVERARAEASLRASEGRYRALVESQGGMLARFRTDGEILYVNDAYARTFGATRERLVGTCFWDLIPPAEHDGVRARLALLTPQSPMIQIENMIATPDGPRWTLWTNRALEFDAAGRVVEAQSTGVDITDRKGTEAALHQSEQRLRAVAANLPNGAAFVIGTDFRYQLAAGLALGPAGFDPTALEGKTVAEALGPDLAAEYEANYRRALGGETFETEHHSHGRHYVTHGAPLRDADGRVTAALAVSYDITDRVRAEAAVRASEEQLRRILESATDYAIITLAPDRTVTSWSPGAAVTFGYSPEEIVGRPADVLFTPEDRAAGAAEREAETARRDGRAADERWHLRKDGSRFFASGVLAPLGDGNLGFVKVARDLTARKRMEDELEARVRERTAELAAALEVLEGEMERRRELTRRLATAAEDERRRVSRDLHDSLGQLQAGLGLAVAAARRTPGLPVAAGERLAEAGRLVDELARETHALAVRLRPTALDDFGLAAALAQLAADWSARTGLPVGLQTDGLGAGRLAAEVETAVYRLVQEALTNVQKHARASWVGVSVTRPAGRVTVTVEDDGVGFDPSGVVPGRLGLLGMKERVDQAGGTLQVESVPGGGTTLLARFALGGERENAHDQTADRAGG